MSNAGVWSSIVILIFSIVFIWNSTKVDYEGPLGFGPGFFPLWLSILLLILSLIYLVISLKENIKLVDIFPDGTSKTEFLVILASMVLFVALLNYTGFVIASTLSLTLLLYKKFNWIHTIAISIVISLAIFFIFAKALVIPLPVNALGW